MYRDSSSLQDILNAGKKIAEFSDGMTIKELAKNEVYLSAILYQFIVIGEATRRLSNELRDSHPEIPWKKMAGMRNILTHQYDRVDLDLLGEAIRVALPNVVEKIEQLVLSS